MLTLLLAVFAWWTLSRYGFDTVLAGTWLSFRWLSGILGFVCVAAVMTYPLRKQVYRRRAGALRYWMLVHVYAGVIAAILLLMHSGRHTGGLLTTALYVSFICGDCFRRVRDCQLHHRASHTDQHRRQSTFELRT